MSTEASTVRSARSGAAREGRAASTRDARGVPMPVIPGEREAAPHPTERAPTDVASTHAIPASAPTHRRLDAGLPVHVSVHKSGGRDRWSPPLERAPDDPVAAARACLAEVLDPEIPISLVDLGLIYGLEVEDHVARVRLTFTATACPCVEFIREDVTDRLLQEPWLRAVEIEEVWDPPWSTDLITPEGRDRLKRLGVGVA